MATNDSLVLDAVGFAFDDGTEIFDELTATFGQGITGVIGPNGLGKSVLLRLLSGELEPTLGKISRPPNVAVLPQRLTLQSERTVAELLGVGEVLAAIDELTEGEPDAERAAVLLERIGDQWDAKERSLAALSELGIGSLSAEEGTLARQVGTLSGGEAMLVALAGLRLQEPELTLLDEPSNHLDAPARAALIASLGSWPGIVVVVSHDRELLRAAHAIAQLRPRRVRAGRADGVVLEMFGGGWEDFEERTAALRGAQERDAESGLARERRTAQAARSALAASARQGKIAAQSMPKILANTRKNVAEGTAGRVKSMHAARVAHSQEALEEAQEALRDVGGMDIDRPGTRLGAGTVALVGQVPRFLGDAGAPGAPGASGGEVPRLFDDGTPLPAGSPLEVRGPERVALTGPNGAGKSRLLEELLPGARVPVGVLRQRAGAAGADPLDFRDDDSVLANLLRCTPGLLESEARSLLARLRLRGARVLEPYGRLSGGERFRVDLAAVLTADPAPSLLVLDEPSNDLDLDSIDELQEALRGYGGALIVVSHDADFLSRLGVTRGWELR